jgi:hypothetical protein
MKRRSWKEEDLLSLYEAYSKPGIGSGIAMDLPENLLERHSRAAIHLMASRMGLTRRHRDGVLQLDEWSEPEIAYLAGLIDGEGCLDMRVVSKKDGRIRYPCRIHITNTHLGLVEWLKAKIGHGCYCRDIRATRTTKPAYTFVISATNDVKAILDRCMPYFIVKRDKAIEMLEFIKAKSL